MWQPLLQRSVPSKKLPILNAVASPDNTLKITHSQCYVRVVARDIEKLTGSCRCPDKNHVNNAHESSSDDNASNLNIFYSRAAARGFDTHKQGDGKKKESNLDLDRISCEVHD